MEIDLSLLIRYSIVMTCNHPGGEYLTPVYTWSLGNMTGMYYNERSDAVEALLALIKKGD